MSDPPRWWICGVRPPAAEVRAWDRIVMHEASVVEAPFVLTDNLRLTEGMVAHLMPLREQADWVRIPDTAGPSQTREPREVWLYMGSLSELEDLRPTRETPRPFAAPRPPGAGS